MMTAKRFEKLTAPRKRMAIARDVLATLALPARKRYTLMRGIYCTAIPSTEVGQRALSTATEFSEILPVIEKHCYVCGMGAMFISHVRINDAVSVDSISYRFRDSLLPRVEVDGDFIVRTMGKYFPSDQLRSIEWAFEGGWSDSHPNPEALLVAICNNIVRNKGNFMFGQRR